MDREASPLSDEQLEVLRSMIDDERTPETIALRARLVLGSESEQWRAVARALGVSLETVAMWRRRYLQEGPAGLQDRAHNEDPPGVRRRRLEGILRHALARVPGTAEGWSLRKAARLIGLSPATLRPAWRALRRQMRAPKTGEGKRPGFTRRQFISKRIISRRSRQFVPPTAQLEEL